VGINRGRLYKLEGSVEAIVLYHGTERSGVNSALVWGAMLVVYFLRRPPGGGREVYYWCSVLH
jgi:hypothetical protein